MKQITITINDPETEYAERAYDKREADARRREAELLAEEREQALKNFFAKVRANNERT